MGYEELKKCLREDEVKNHIITELKISLDMRFNIDCYHENVLFEFKYDKDVKKAEILAQAVYYLNILYKNGEKIPPFVSLISLNECVVFETIIFESIYKKNNYFIEGSPSNPSTTIVVLLEEFKNNLYYYSDFETEQNYNDSLSAIKDLIKRKRILSTKIKAANVKRAYNGYVRQLGDYILENSNSNGIFEFRADAIGKATIINETITGDYIMDFQFDNGAKRFENISKSAYDSYWRQWKRIDSDIEAKEVFKTIYDLLGISDRRTKGQFYTPKHLALKAWERIVKELGENFWENGNWRIWDCCAGTGNLEYDIIPESCMQYVYLSTLDVEEVDQLKQNFPLNRKIFQYNFLNDHSNKLPNNLKEDMNNPNIKWLFLINPPYVESQGVTNVQSGVTQSNLQDIMKMNGLGNSSRELFSQFLFRIERDFKGKYCLGLFSSVKFIVSSKFDAFRKYWLPVFKNGFVCNASEHFQCKGNWPLIFSIFDRRNSFEWDQINTHWNNLELIYDVIDKKGNVIGTKRFGVYNQEYSFRNYFPENTRNLTTKMPLLSSGIKLSTGKIYCQPYGPQDFLGTMIFIGPDFQQQNRCFLVSGIANTNHNNIYITKENYKEVLSGFALYKAPNFSWLDNKDFFMIPSRKLTEIELNDCLLYALVCASNQTATYKFNDGSIIINRLNPLDEELFNFNKLSDEGNNVYKLLKKYLFDIVKFDKLNTIFGTGRYLGLYQYRMDIDNQCFGVKFPKELDDAIEKLRLKIEQLSRELCFL